MHEDMKPVGDPLHDNILALVHIVSNFQGKVIANVSDGDMYASADPAFAMTPGAISTLENLQALVVGSLRPLSIMSDPAKEAGTQISIGSLEINLDAPNGIERVLADLELISNITRNVKSGSEDAFTFGRAGSMNLNQGAFILRASSYMELGLKIIAIRSPGMANDIESAIQLDIHGNDEFEIRTQDQWLKLDIDEIVARAKDELKISLENTVENEESGPQM